MRTDSSLKTVSRISGEKHIVDIPESVRPLFDAAGWKPGRAVPVDGRVPGLHPAHDILRELGGLRVGRSGRGIECACSDLRFRFVEDEDDGILSSWTGLLRSELVAVAEVHNSHGLLILDSAGRCFGGSLIHDAFYFEGHSFGEAVERLLIGRKARPMLRPGQDRVSLYGETFAQGHPAIFDYRS